MLVVVLERDRVLLGRVVVNVHYCHIGLEPARSRQECVERMRRRHAARSANSSVTVIRDQPFARLTRQRRRVEQCERGVVNVGWWRIRILRTHDRLKSRGGACAVRESHRNGQERIADLLIRDLQVLVRDKPKQLVLHNRSAERSTYQVPVQLWILQILGNAGVVLEKEGCSIDPVRASASK